MSTEPMSARRRAEIERLHGLATRERWYTVAATDYRRHVADLLVDVDRLVAELAVERENLGGIFG